jgi:hypothetical protein
VPLKSPPIDGQNNAEKSKANAFEKLMKRNALSVWAGVSLAAPLLMLWGGLTILAAVPILIVFLVPFLLVQLIQVLVNAATYTLMILLPKRRKSDG